MAAQRSTVFLSLALGAAACATTGAREDPTKPQKAAASVSVAVAPGAPDAAAPAASAASPAPTAFYPVAEGACPSARPYTVGATPVLVIDRDVWAMGPTEAHPLYRMWRPYWDRFSGFMNTTDHVGDVGGVDETHFWVQRRTSGGRGEDSSTVYVYSPEEHELKTPRGASGFYGHLHVIPQPDGSVWVYGNHSMYLDIPGDLQDGVAHHKYFAFSPRGELLTMNLPGPDMASAVRMASGEIVSAGRHGNRGEKIILRRWSPEKKVDDLVADGDASEFNVSPGFAVGTVRAVVGASKKRPLFYDYRGDKLNQSPLNARAKDMTSWLLTTADELMFTSPDGTLFVEAKDGTVSEEKLPEPGKLAGDQAVPWLIANSGALYMRRDGAWTKLGLPNGPWLAEPHPPSRVEWVKQLGAETWVATVRTDAGFGRKKPGEVRTFYATKPRPAPLRCGAPFPPDALGTLPPPADAACTNLVVVVATEIAKDEKSSYPKLGAPLKGVAAFGDALTFVGFGAGPDRLLGIVAATPDVAKELVKRLTPVTTSVPETVCGAPSEHRRLRFDVKTGVFSAP